MLMGTADVVAAPTESVVFLEDMTDVQKAEKVIRSRTFSFCWSIVVVASREFYFIVCQCSGRCAFSWTEEHG